MSNFPVEVDGKTYWISRSNVVVGVIFSRFEDQWYVLANKRGKGLPNYQGYWNLPSGYLEYNETIEEACAREIWEETGVFIDKSNIYLTETISDPGNNENQAIIHRCLITDTKGHLISQTLTSEHAEKDEVSNIKWIKVRNIDVYKWAFNHDVIIKYYNTHFNE